MKQLDLDSAQRFLVFATGDEVVATLKKLNVDGATFMAIGAFERAIVAYWNWDTKEYERIPIDEQVEVLSMIGNVGRDENSEPVVHAHVTLGRRSGETIGGHLMEGHVRPTLELVLTPCVRLTRKIDPLTRLKLLAI